MKIFSAAMMSVCLAVVACGKPAPAPNKDFSLEKAGLASINLPGNSVCDWKDEYKKYDVAINDGIIGIRTDNSSFDLSQDSEEGKELYDLLERLNNPAERAATEKVLKEQKYPWTVVELLSFSNGFRGLVHADSKGRKSYGFVMKRGDVYYYIDSTGTADEDLHFFDKVKAGIESIK
jgi:hypothetical protein